MHILLSILLTGGQALDLDAAQGEELIHTLESLTGIPKSLICQELDRILGQTGKSVTNLTLEELRGALMVYLESLQNELLLDQYSQFGPAN